MRRFKRYIPVLGLAALLALALSPAAFSGEEEKDGKTPPVEAIVHRTNHASYYQGKDGRAKVSMTITDSQGRKRTREFIILRRDDPPPEGSKEKGDDFCGDQRFYVYFLRPSDVNKMVFMVWKHADERPDDRWLYLPALDLVKRIAAKDKRTSFVGSHFFYEDVSGRGIEEDVHELVKVTDNYFVLKNTPKVPGDVEFSYFTMWIHKGTYLPVKIEYYDRKGKKYRVYEALKVEKIQGRYTVTRARMKDLESGGETVLAYKNVTYDVGLPEEIFTERYLRRAPAKYLR